MLSTVKGYRPDLPTYGYCTADYGTVKCKRDKTGDLRPILNDPRGGKSLDEAEKPFGKAPKDVGPMVLALCTLTFPDLQVA